MFHTPPAVERKLCLCLSARRLSCASSRYEASRRRIYQVTRTAAESEDSQHKFSLAPSSPSTPFGQLAAYYLEQEPGLFKSAIEDRFQQLKDEKEAREARDAQGSTETGSTDIVQTSLQDRIQQVRESESRASVEDLMYMLCLEQFINLGVGMLPRTDDYTGVDSVVLSPLMDGVHSKEALELVRDHIMGLMGQTAKLPPTATLKMSKLQMLQVYAASVMFGYFLRRVDQRFQLSKAAGFLPVDKEDAVERLERLFSMETDSSDPDVAISEGDGSNTSDEDEDSPKESRGPVLKRYVESFDKETMREMTRVMSKEGAGILDRQVKALWGDVSSLQAEMQEVLGSDPIASVEEVMQRAESAVAEDRVQTVTMPLTTQRRAVLEAVAFGTFVRDTEMYVDREYGLLTQNPSSDGPGRLPSV